MPNTGAFTVQQKKKREENKTVNVHSILNKTNSKVFLFTAVEEFIGFITYVII